MVIFHTVSLPGGTNVFFLVTDSFFWGAWIFGQVIFEVDFLRVGGVV